MATVPGVRRQHLLAAHPPAPNAVGLYVLVPGRYCPRSRPSRSHHQSQSVPAHDDSRRWQPAGTQLHQRGRLDSGHQCGSGVHLLIPAHATVTELLATLPLFVPSLGVTCTVTVSPDMTLGTPAKFNASDKLEVFAVVCTTVLFTCHWYVKL